MNTNIDSVLQNLIEDPYFRKWVINPDSACEDFWAHWADQSEERQECIDRARAVLLSFEFSSEPVSQVEKDQLWDQITAKIEEPAPTRKMGKPPGTTRNLWYGITAAAILLGMVFFAYNRDWKEPIEVTQSKTELIEKVAPEGKISSFRFEDGTTVKLFSGSIIRYPVTFSEESRVVYLEGEGFFEVARDTKRPFMVKTNSLTTTALGTSFNIHTFEETSQCNVSLVTGKVRVEMLKNSGRMVKAVFLEPGEEAIIKLDDVVKQPFNIEETISWKDGYIYLENKSFDETITILKRWFKVDFVINNRAKIEYQLKGKTGKGTFKNQSLENILRVIGYSFEFKYEINDNTVILTF